MMQFLKDLLKNEPAGSMKIQALADYAQLKIQQHLQLQPQSMIMIAMIQQKYYCKDAHIYEETFENASTILAPYLENNEDPYRQIRNDLKEINKRLSMNDTAWF